MKNSCASCIGVDVKNIIKTNNDKLPKWLNKIDYVSNFINSKKSFKIYHQKKTNMKLTINVGKSNKNKFILYWGAEPSKKILIKDAKKAYGNFKNYGVAKINEKGDATLFFNCPQPYSTIEKGKKNRETFYRHLHFCISNKDNNKWLDTVYTKIIICKINIEDTLNLLHNGSIILLNTLPHKYYAKSHIPNSYNLFHKEIKKMSQKELTQWFSDVVEKNYPNLNKLIKQKKINYYELPIVVYCAHEKCNASELAAIELLKKGFVNIIDFKGGMKDYMDYI